MKSRFVKIVLLSVVAACLVVGYFGFKKTHHYQINLQTQISQNFTKDFAGVIEPTDPLFIPDKEVMVKEGTLKSLPALLKGEWALVNLWATWCAPCIAELPSLLALQKKFPDLNIIALSFDNNKEIEFLNNFMKKHKVEGLTLAYDKNLHIRREIETRGLPTTLLVSPNGQVLLILEGHIDWAAPESVLFFENLIGRRER